MLQPHTGRSSLRQLASVISCCTVIQVATAATPTALRGRWEVIQVAVDRQDQAHWLYLPDDPRLLGRQLVIDRASIRLDDGSRICKAPAFTTLPTEKLQRFIGTRFPRPASFERPAEPTLADFGIQLADMSIAPLQVHCTPEESPWNGAWLVPAPGNRLLTNDDGSGEVLVLRKQNAHPPIQASFACTKAHSPAERTICASAMLAGYDRSVAAAYRFALQRTGDNASSLRQAQRKWIESRDACGTDANCLAESMRNRTEQLMQQ